MDTTVLLDSFLALKQLRGLSPRTLQGYRQRIGHYVRWLDGQAIDRASILAYMTELHRTHTTTTVAAYIREVSVFCAWLVEEKYLDTNPAARLKPRLPKRRPCSYTKDQLQQMLVAANVRDRALMLTLLDTGIRVSELCGMRRSHIDRDGAFTVIGKGNKERRCWLNTLSFEAIGMYLRTRPDRSDVLWLGKQGTALTPSGVHQVIARLARKAGIRDEVRRLVHSFRATFAKFYVLQGGDVESLRRLFGHETITMSAHYAQLADEDLGMQKRRVNPTAHVF